MAIAAVVRPHAEWSRQYQIQHTRIHVDSIDVDPSMSLLPTLLHPLVLETS